MPDDQSELDIAREHFIITMQAYKNALATGSVDNFYNHVLDGLEAIAEMTQAHENGELELEEFERVQVLSLKDFKKLNIGHHATQKHDILYNNINACPVCASTEIKKVDIIHNYTDGGGDQQRQSDGHQCKECGHIFEIDFYPYNDIEPRSLSENSD